MKVTLGERIKSMSMFPDVGKLIDMFNQKFDALIAKLDEILAELRKQNGQALIILAVVLVLAFIGLLAVCTPGENDHSLGKIQLVNHERDRCYDYDCGDEGDYDDGYGRGGDGGDSGGHQGYGGGGGRSGDQGDGDGQCRNFCNITVPTPGGGGGDQPPPDERTQSLVPPTPDKIIQGFQTMVDAGINLGTTIARLVTDYVVTVFRFIV